MQSKVSFKELAQSLVMGSVLVQHAPLVPSFLQDGIALAKGEQVKKSEEAKAADDSKVKNKVKKSEVTKSEEAKVKNKDEKAAEENTEEKKEEEKSESKDEVVSDFVLEKDPCGAFSRICSRLHLSNPLGLGRPSTVEDSLKAWKELKGLEIDFGPRSKKKGSPGTDRIVANLSTYAVQYLHIFLGLMILRAFIFRSFFACLPWMVIYQFLSMVLPLGQLSEIADSLPSFIPADKIPFDKVPLEKVPVELRVVATLGFHGLLQFFFLYELLWKTYFIEKLLLAGVVTYHSYAVRPIDA